MSQDSYIDLAVTCLASTEQFIFTFRLLIVKAEETFISIFRLATGQ